MQDDAKNGGVVDSLRLQVDIDVLVKWTEKWQTEFNPDKCEVRHFENTNEAERYSMNSKFPGDIEVQV